MNYSVILISTLLSIASCWALDETNSTKNPISRSDTELPASTVDRALRLNALVSSPYDQFGLVAASTFSPERVEAISKLALTAWANSRNLGDIEAIHVMGCFKTYRPIKDFSKEGDTIWEARVLWGFKTPSGVLWINERTKKVIGLGLYKEI